MLKLSEMTGKLAGLFGINVSPIGNAYCDAMSKIPGTVCEHCYSRKMLTSFRKKCQPSFKRNGDILRGPIAEQELPRVPVGAYVRFLAHGELEDLMQLTNLCLIADRNPASKFVLWTKRTDLLDHLAYKPVNMKIVQSSKYVGKADEKHRMADSLFTVVKNEGDVEGDWKCDGKKCADCLFCYTNQGHVVEVLK